MRSASSSESSHSSSTATGRDVPRDPTSWAVDETFGASAFPSPCKDIPLYKHRARTYLGQSRGSQRRLVCRPLRRASRSGSRRSRLRFHSRLRRRGSSVQGQDSPRRVGRSWRRRARRRRSLVVTPTRCCPPSERRRLLLGRKTQRRVQKSIRDRNWRSLLLSRDEVGKREQALKFEPEGRGREGNLTQSDP